MRNVLIYDIAAEKTGALAVLKKYHESYYINTKVQSFFITSQMELPENEHTKLIKLPWIKKSYFHRLYCDKVYIKKLIKQLKIDEVLNLQNVAIKGLNIPQTLYLHNAIPFTNIDFDIRTEKSLWLFKHVISKLIINGLYDANKIIVQAQWIKKELIKKYNIDESKIIIERFVPSISGENERIKYEKTLFFFPANFCSYKNHRCILQACDILKSDEYQKFEVIFTFLPSDGKRQRELSERVNDKQLPVKFVGLLNQNEMATMYRMSTLVFPSNLETVGLPLLEAQYYHAPIVSVDLPYAREALCDYSNVMWFKKDDAEGLAQCMRKMMDI